jgi:manganese/zinc/iron transport system permease protein
MIGMEDVMDCLFCKPESCIKTRRRIKTSFVALFMFAFPAWAYGAYVQGDASADFQILAGFIQWPGWDQLWRVLSLRDYNTRVVLIGTFLFGVAAGLIGTFMLLRKRSLVADAVSHATLPGIGLAFLILTASGLPGKTLFGLLIGALVTGVLAVGVILLIRNSTRLKEDAALGIVLSVFFGMGVALLGVIQKMETGHAAGLESFIYGKTASMLARDAIMMGAIAGAMIVACAVMFKEFTLVCFDSDYAGSQGWPVAVLDTLMMSLVVGVTIIGLQAVGLIMVVALLIIPPAAARFWTHHLLSTLLISALIGGLSGLFGSGVSALMPRLPAGAIIVVIAGLFFLASMIFGKNSGLLIRWYYHLSLMRNIAYQHLLRALFESIEPAITNGETSSDGAYGASAPKVSFHELLTRRSWSPRRLHWKLKLAQRKGLIRQVDDNHYRLTEKGFSEARRLVRNHRLWELYLINYADTAPSHVDRNADRMEHVISSDIVQRLEKILAEKDPHLVPPSPHEIEPRQMTSTAGGASHG